MKRSVQHPFDFTLDNSKRIDLIHDSTIVGPNKTDISYHTRGSNRNGDLEGEGSHLHVGDYIILLSPELLYTYT